MRNYFAEERQPNLDLRITARGYAILDAYEFRGPILFVGGPKHNQFVNLSRWLRNIDIAIYPKVPVMYHFDEPAEMPNYRKVTYELQPWTSEMGAEYFIYQFRG